MLRPPPYASSRLTLKRRLNYYLSLHEHLNRRIVLRSRPTKLIIEPTNVCNLRCPACFTGDGQVGRVRGGLSMELYERLLDELGDYLIRIDFCNWGEPLLNKNIEAMVASATKRGISTLISTNFSFPFDDARAERLVASGLTILGVSLDGARQETYEKYRVRGDIATVLENCRRVNAAKRRLNSPTPAMGWEFHVFEHNTGDVEEAKAMARELEMELAVEKGWVVGDEWDTAGEWGFSLHPVPIPCVYLWQYGVVNNDGGVSPCCGTFYREDDLGRLSVRSGRRRRGDVPRYLERRAVPGGASSLALPVRSAAGSAGVDLPRLSADGHVGRPADVAAVARPVDDASGLRYVRVRPRPFPACGAVAQLGERLNGIQEVVGSIPIGSTFLLPDHP